MPVSVEGGTIFLQRSGKALREFLFSDAELSYQSNNISLLSSHLLKSPVKIAFRRATSTDDGDLLMIVNGNDGTMAAYYTDHKRLLLQVSSSPMAHMKIVLWILMIFM